MQIFINSFTSIFYAERPFVGGRSDGGALMWVVPCDGGD